MFCYMDFKLVISEHSSIWPLMFEPRQIVSSFACWCQAAVLLAFIRSTRNAPSLVLKLEPVRTLHLFLDLNFVSIEAVSSYKFCLFFFFFFLLVFPCLSLLIYVSEFCRTQLITQKFLFLKAKQWITSDMKVWINSALLTFLTTEHI